MNPFGPYRFSHQGQTVAAAAPSQTVTFDPVNTGSGTVLSNGNKTATKTTTGWNSTFSTTSVTSNAALLLYYEFKITAAASTSNMLFGVYVVAIGTGSISDDINTYMSNNNWAWERAASGSGGAAFFTYVGTTGSYSAGVGDVISVALNLVTGKGWIGYNNNFGTGNPATGTNPDFTWVPATLHSVFNPLYIGMSLNGAAGAVGATLQTAAATQSYSPPTGFSPWE